MDNLDCNGQVVDQTLRELDVINHWLGGNAVTLSGLRKLLQPIDPNQPISIADLGCGSGEMLRLISKGERKNVTLIGIDANPNITSFAEKLSTGFDDIQFMTQNIFSKEFRQTEFDVILATLFFHHFDNVCSQLKSQAKIGVVINDIHRHPLSYHSIGLLTKFFSKSSMVKYDAPLSVLRAFKKQELIDIMTQADIKNYSIKWKWAFRWQVIIYSTL
jgi:SAM-dependent methyltransferase